jgi:hypothetical protein
MAACGHFENEIQVAGRFADRGELHKVWVTKNSHKRDLVAYLLSEIWREGEPSFGDNFDGNDLASHAVRGAFEFAGWAGTESLAQRIVIEWGSKPFHSARVKPFEWSTEITGGGRLTFFYGLKFEGR